MDKTRPASASPERATLKPAPAMTAADSAAKEITLVEDKLDRKDEAKLLKKFLQAEWKRHKNSPKKEGLVVSIDGPWGSGKTTFLKFFADELAEACVVQINAWESDFGADPLIAVSEPILNAITPPITKGKKATADRVASIRGAIGKLVRAGVKGGLHQLTVKLVGEESEDELTAAFQDIINNVMDEGGDLSGDAVQKLLDKQAEKRSAIAELRDSIRELIKSSDQIHTPPIYILIDELDRCRPTYAISLLEQIKHIFEIPEFIFVIATNSDQLSHSIQAVYGQGFDSSEYLRRFFPFTFKLAECRSTKKLNDMNRL